MPLPVGHAAWLSALVAPVQADEFLGRHWCRRHLFCRGDSNRYEALLSWPDVNDILEHHWREVYRFRLARQGRDLDPASYADLDGFTPRVRARDVTDHLRRGATLSFDAIDELHPPLTRFAEAFERCFHGGTKINIYAGWRALHGLDLHRDNQEIFILQLDGRKRWLLYGFSIDGLDREDLRRTSAPPQGAELDVVLAPGDLLYIPRGCYHVAIPMNEPTLHLTIGVKVPRVGDLIRWMASRPDVAALAADDIPIQNDAAGRARFTERLLSEMTKGLDRDLVEQYLRETGSNLKPRPSFSLPYSATPGGVPPHSDFMVRLNPPLPRRCSADGTAWRCGGRVCHFPRGAAALFDALADAELRSFTDVLAKVSPTIDEPSLRLLLGMLIGENLVAIRPMQTGR